MVIKLSMYAALYDVHPTIDVNFAFRRKLKVTATCNFVSLGEKIRELLVKKWKKKKKKKKKKRGKEKRKINQK